MIQTPSKPGRTVDLLLRRFRELLDETSVEAVTKGSIPPERLKALSALKRLIELRQTETARRQKRRWFVVASALLMFLLVAAWIPVPETELDLEARVAGLSYITATGDPQYVLGSIDVREIHAQGLQTVQAPSVFHQVTAIRAGRVDFSDTSRTSGITLEMAPAPAGTTISWTADRVPGWFQVRITPPQAGYILDGSLRGGVAGTLSQSPSPQENARSELGGRFSLRAGSELTTQFAVAPQATFELPPRLLIRSLDLRISEPIYRPYNSPKEFFEPSILSGKIYLPETGKEIPLEHLDSLQFEFDNGTIESLIAVPRHAAAVESEIPDVGPSDQFLLHFHGSVRHLRRVSGRDLKANNVNPSMMPSCLEWLVGRPGLVLLSTVIGSVLAFAGSALKLLGTKK